MAYQFDIGYKATKEHGNADGLSRLTTQIDPAIGKVESGENSEIVRNISEAMIGFPLTHDDISRETLKDDNLKSAIKFEQRDCWPKWSSLKDELKRLYIR